MNMKRSTGSRVVPDHEQIPYEHDQIVCPKCLLTQIAKIKYSGFNPVKFHRCINCTYMITAKDWNSIL